MKGLVEQPPWEPFDWAFDTRDALTGSTTLGAGNAIVWYFWIYPGTNLTFVTLCWESAMAWPGTVVMTDDSGNVIYCDTVLTPPTSGQRITLTFTPDSTYGIPDLGGTRAPIKSETYTGNIHSKRFFKIPVGGPTTPPVPMPPPPIPGQEPTETDSYKPVEVWIGPPLTPAILLNGTMTWNIHLGTDVNPITKDADITNSGVVGSYLNWIATLTDLVGLSGSISLAPSSGRLIEPTSEACAVTVDPAGLVVGTWTGKLRVNDQYLPDLVTEQVLDITVVVTPAVPVMTLSGTLTYSFKIGVDVNPKSVNENISNTGDPGSTVNWVTTLANVAAALTGKISESATSGSLAQGASTIDIVSVDPTGIAPGHYTADLKFDDSVDPVLVPQQVLPIDVTVIPAYPDITLGGDSMVWDFLMEGQTSTAVTKTLTIENTGEVASVLDWTATPVGTGIASTLSIVDSTGSNNQNVQTSSTVSLNPTGLAAGTYNGTISVSAPDATTKTVPVTVTVRTCSDADFPATMTLWVRWYSLAVTLLYSNQVKSCGLDGHLVVYPQVAYLDSNGVWTCSTSNTPVPTLPIERVSSGYWKSSAIVNAGNYGYFASSNNADIPAGW